ncbi:MAG: hypothetical protein ACREUL_18555 [Steroidobacteraceae bacterium]
MSRMVLRTPARSLALAGWLALLLGPAGMLYSTTTGALAVAAMWAVLVVPASFGGATALLGLWVVLTPISATWAIYAAKGGRVIGVGETEP